MTASSHISVIVPLYFRDPADPRVKEGLTRFLLQFPNQHCDAVEIFLTDSGPDTQQGVIEAWLIPWLYSHEWLSPRVRYVYLPQTDGPLSRGAAMNIGIQETSGDMLLFLHGDCFLPPQGLNLLRDAVSQGIEAGGFLKQYDQKKWWSLLQLTERYLNWIRTVWSRQMVGTNAMFISRSLLSEHPYQGDFLEDVEMSDWLKHRVPQTSFRVIREYVTVSARKYQKYGTVGTIAINAAVMIFYRMFRISPSILKHRLYLRPFASGWTFWPELARVCWQIVWEPRHHAAQRRK